MTPTSSNIKTLATRQDVDPHLLHLLAELGLDPQILLSYTRGLLRPEVIGHRTQTRQSRHRARSRSHTTSPSSSDGDGGGGEPPASPPPSSTNPTKTLEDLFRTQYPSLVRRALRYVGEAEAEDAVSDVFLKLHESGTTLSAGALHIAVRNRCFDILKHRQRSFNGSNHKRAQLTEPDPGSDCVDDSLAIGEASIQKHQDDALHGEHLQLLDAAEALLQILSAIERRVVELHFLAGLPYAAVASRLGITIQAARVRACRAVQRMKEAAL